MAILDPIQASSWDRAKARHLLNRAGFGVPHRRIDALAKLGPKMAVSSLIDYEDVDPEIANPDFLVKPISGADRREALKGKDEEERRAWNQQRQREERAAVSNLRTWWMARMLHTARPFEEKMCLFWHGHFATSAQKVKESEHNYRLNTIFRDHAAGNFKALTIAVGQSPAMLRYLDNRQSTKRKPNENWARELMELFTMGEGQYTEHDIKESARAFTGWASNHEKFVYNERNHDTDEKTFLGRKGNFDGWDIIDIIMEQPVTAEFICWKLCSFFAYSDPEPALVKGLAKTFRKNDYEVKPVLRQLFLSKAFYSGRAVGTQIKSPAQLMVQLAADLGIEQPPYQFMAQSAASLGQNILHPPNVKGWDGNRAWINANTLLGRYNQPQRLAFAVVARDKKAANAKTDKPSDMKMASGREGMRMMPSKGGQAYSDMTGAEPDAPWVAGEKAVMAKVEAAVREKFAAMEPRERRETSNAWRKAGRTKKEQMLEEMDIDVPLGVPTPLTLAFDKLKFKNGAECIDALLGRFLVTPVSQDQRTALLEALGIKNPKAKLSVEDVSFASRQAVIHLITSMAEYQLC